MAGPFSFDQIKPVNPLLALFPIGNYGIEHAFRIYKLVESLAEFEKLDDASCQVLKFCALFVDISREENQMNSKVGLKSYEKLRGQNFLGKASFKNELVHFIFQSIDSDKLDDKLEQFNLVNREEAIMLFKILKDALALDAFRFGNFCAADLELSNSKKLVLFASQFHRKEIKQDEILKEIEDWLKEIQ